MPRKSPGYDSRIAPEQGKRIAAAIHAARISKADLARSCGVTRGTVTLWCTGKRTPGADNLAKIAAATRQSVAFLVPDQLHGPDNLDTLARKLGTRLGLFRLEAVSHLGDGELLSALDDLIGRGVASGKVPLSSQPKRRKAR